MSGSFSSSPAARAPTAPAISVPELPRLPRALLPLDAAPTVPAWNMGEVADLLPAGTALRPAAVLVGLVPRDGGTCVLLTVRHAELRHHGGQISFPGGRMEPEDADPVAAALREAAEEVGLAREQAAPVGYLDPLVTITGFHVFPVVARVSPDFVPAIDPREVDELFEVPLSFLLDPANAHAAQIEWKGRPRRVVEFQWGGYRIWGATAAMLVNLRMRLEAAR
ncbi:NUDIX hydrolase [Coralloluteibacterium thermophilus]|uniref:NUDIX hydrolase n=1 Tax=Coralloluteibacterium thermophilum TaxID=2707049 RepID=A0ABV9NKF4_9GAMM